MWVIMPEDRRHLLVGVLWIYVTVAFVLWAQQFSDLMPIAMSLLRQW